MPQHPRVREKVGSAFYEGHGEHRTRHASFEHQCPTCDRWSDGSDVTEEIEGRHIMLCDVCARKVIAELFTPTTGAC